MRALIPIASLMLMLGCASIPPLDTTTISQTPASASQMAFAGRIVRVCSGLPDADRVMAAFEAMGHQVGRWRMIMGGGEELVSPRQVSFERGDVIVQASETDCYVGVKGMTPEQSYQLAQPWVRHFGAITNAEAGQGLSPHVVQAWGGRPKGTPVVLIAAHKTWPWDRGEWPDVPGAAVTLWVSPR
ncbi:hypothetical protein DXV76_16100 [Rhodobacteraceae bacterium CCMM004]|nr:hypothetical protein DXV76_16100 [Rhodobacteraceae bacterium CCMM004]